MWSVDNVFKSPIVFIRLVIKSGWFGRWLTMTCSKHCFNFECIWLISSRFLMPCRSGAIRTTAQKSAISTSVNCIEFILSANLKVESTRNLAFAPFWIESRFISCPLRQTMESIDVSNRLISLTKSASNRPALRRVNLSFWVRRSNPGIFPANSITPRMTSENLCENSCSDWISGAGFNGHAWMDWKKTRI